MEMPDPSPIDQHREWARPQRRPDVGPSLQELVGNWNEAVGAESEERAESARVRAAVRGLRRQFAIAGGCTRCGVFHRSGRVCAPEDR